MPRPVVVLLSIPALRAQDLAGMPHLQQLVRHGDQSALVPSFPAVTCPVQANMTTGRLPAQHGVVANGFYWRSRHEVEMWTAGNDCILVPQIWDVLHDRDPALKSAAWFPLHSKSCGADLICTPAPIHQPDGRELPWCHTKPERLYGTLRDRLGHFPLQHFWGPLADISSSAWIADSAIYAAHTYRPDFFYIYLPHLDYAAQKMGPDSVEAAAAVGQLDDVLGRLINGFDQAYPATDLLWLVASEYAIVPVDHVLYPNRLLREAGLLQVRAEDDGEYLDLAASKAWALVDHQHAHVFVQHGDAAVIGRVASLFAGREGVADVLVGDDLGRYALKHERSGDVILVSVPNSWQAYYWWLDDHNAPSFARTVDIHRKPGYDPVELCFDPNTRGIPLSGACIRGSHGAPADDPTQYGVLLSSRGGITAGPGARRWADWEVAGLVLRQFG
ncbi:MAG: nucleotide pyrophosphatase [Planctomycetes bacterium RBG_16_64_10]|nr:MAG: nucleotide pyrophosphatase [Planctomycetes bacterium RBG_16_64_10]